MLCLMRLSQLIPQIKWDVVDESHPDENKESPDAPYVEIDEVIEDVPDVMVLLWWTSRWQSIPDLEWLTR